MILSIIVSSAVVVLFFIKCIDSLILMPRIYKKLKLLPNRYFSFYKISIFGCGSKDLIVSKGQKAYLILDKIFFSFSWEIADIKKEILGVNNYFCCNNNLEITINNKGIAISGKGTLRFIFKKPNSEFYIDSSKKILCINNKFFLSFIGFKKIDFLGNNEIIIDAEILEFAKIYFINMDLQKNFQNYSLKLKQYFGFYDFSDLDFISKMQDIDLPQNKLIKNYLKNLLTIDKKTVNLDFLPTDTPNCTKINLTNLGVSRLVKFEQKRNSIIIFDILCNIKIEVKNASKIISRHTFFGIDYIYVENFKNLEYIFSPKLIKQNLLNATLLYGFTIALSKKINFENFFLNLNRLILHGYYIDIYAIIKNINLQYLNKETRLIVANLILNFMYVFKNFKMLYSRNIKSFLIDNFKYAILQKSELSLCLLKNLLPFIKNEKISNLILDEIIKRKRNLKYTEYETIFTFLLGLRLSGNKLYLNPKTKGVLDFVVWLKGHKIYIKKPQGSQNIQINGLLINGLDYLNIDKYDKEIFIEFVD